MEFNHITTTQITQMFSSVSPLLPYHVYTGGLFSPIISFVGGCIFTNPLRKLFLIPKLSRYFVMSSKYILQRKTIKRNMFWAQFRGWATFSSTDGVHTTLIKPLGNCRSLWKCRSCTECIVVGAFPVIKWQIQIKYRLPKHLIIST